MKQKPKKKAKKKAKANHKRWLVIAGVSLMLFAAIAGVANWHLRASLKTPELSKPSAKDLAAAHNVELGVHTLEHRLGERPYTDIIKSEFSFVTSDRDAHWSGLRPSETEFDYTKLDKLQTFASQNDMDFQVHHLVWGERNWLPGWLKKGDFTKEQLLQLIHDHIIEVAGHYKGKVKEWTVVNEVYTRAEHRYNLRDWWADNLGGADEYMDKSFIWAHQADPDAKLIFNDFQNEVPNSVSDSTYNYIKAAKARGVPIHGLGMQMHLYVHNPPNKEAIIKNMQRFADIGVDTYITEFDINVNHLPGASPEEIRRREAQITRDVVDACKAVKSCVSFSAFGITEKNDTLKNLFNTDSHSFMFDSRYRPKPAWSAFYVAWSGDLDNEQ